MHFTDMDGLNVTAVCESSGGTLEIIDRNEGITKVLEVSAHLQQEGLTYPFSPATLSADVSEINQAKTSLLTVTDKFERSAECRVQYAVRGMNILCSRLVTCN